MKNKLITMLTFLIIFVCSLSFADQIIDDNSSNPPKEEVQEINENVSLKAEENKASDLETNDEENPIEQKANENKKKLDKDKNTKDQGNIVKNKDIKKNDASENITEEAKESEEETKKNIETQETKQEDKNVDEDKETEAIAKPKTTEDKAEKVIDSLKHKEKRVIYVAKIEKEKIGLVEGITADEIIINLGQNLHVTPSMRFKVFRKEKRIEIPDNQTAKHYGEYYIGTIEVVDVKEAQSRCRIVEIEPNDNIMTTDKVVSIPGTGYEEIYKQIINEEKAKSFLENARRLSRYNKENSLNLLKEITTEFPKTRVAKCAAIMLNKYIKVEEDPSYTFKGLRNYTPDKFSSSSLSKDIAVDKEGNIWFLNSKRVIIQKFDKEGKLLLTLERKNKFDREILRAPNNIVVDNENNLYVLDTSFKKVSKFDSDGNFINDFDPSNSKFPLHSPVDLAVNSNQDVFILDAGNANIIAFTKNATFWACFGEFEIESITNTPELVAIDTDENNNIYVLDKQAKYLHTFNNNLRKIKRELIPSISSVTDIIVALNRLYLLDSEKCSVLVHDLISESTLNEIATSGKSHGNLEDPTGIDIDSKGYIYITDGRNFSFQKFSNEGEFIYKYGDSQITKADSIAINNKNNLFILNSKSGQIHEVDKYSKAWSLMELKTEYKSLDKIIIDFLGNIYVLDSKKYLVHKFSEDGEVIMSFGSRELFRSPIDVCVDRNKNIYVLDSREYTIKKFDSKGNFIKSIGSRSIRRKKQTSGHFKKPIAISINKNGDLLALDNKLKKVFIFNSDTGELRNVFEKEKINFSSPIDIDVDGFNNIYVADSRKKNVYKFKSDGTLIAKIIRDDDDLNLKKLSSISVDGIGNVFVHDASSQLVFEFN